MSDVLSLRIAALAPWEASVNTPARVEFTTELPKLAGPAGGDRPASWTSRASSCDHKLTNDLLNTWQEARVEGVPLIEFVRYDDVGLWQFVPSYLWPAVFRAVELIEVLWTLAEDLRPKQLQVLEQGTGLDRVSRRVANEFGKAAGIAVTFVRPPATERLRSVPGHLRVALRRLGIGRALFRLQQGVWGAGMNLMASPARRPEHAGRTALWVTRPRDWVADPNRPGRSYDDQYFPLLPALRRRGWTRIVAIDAPYGSPRFVASQLLARLRQPEPGVQWRPFESYRARRRHGVARLLTAQWRSIRTDATFARESAYRGVPLVWALDDELRWVFRDVLPDSVRMVDIASTIVERERPAAVIATYENGPYARALLLAAARRGIPTIGLQHGIIFQNHYDYMHARITNDPVGTPAGIAVPRATCVWGPAWAETLTKAGHYPPDAVVATGHWKYDAWIQVGSRCDAAALRRRVGVAETGPLLLALSAAQDTPGYIRACVQAARAVGCAIIVKLHPREEAQPVRALLQHLGYPPGTLFEGDLLEILPAADVVCAQWSTVVSEAVLLHRPVVLVNLLRLTGMEDYISSGICLYATTADEVRQAVADTLRDSAVRQRLAEARARFIARYFLGTDGHAAERVIETIEGRLEPDARVINAC